MSAWRTFTREYRMSTCGATTVIGSRPDAIHSHVMRLRLQMYRSSMSLTPDAAIFFSMDSEAWAAGIGRGWKLRRRPPSLAFIKSFAAPKWPHVATSTSPITVSVMSSASNPGRTCLNSALTETEGEDTMLNARPGSPLTS